MAAFQDTRFKKDPKPPSLKSVAILGLPPGADLQPALDKAVRVAAGVILTIQLVNAPPNILTPGTAPDPGSTPHFPSSIACVYAPSVWEYKWKRATTTPGQMPVTK